MDHRKETQKTAALWLSVMLVGLWAVTGDVREMGIYAGCAAINRFTWPFFHAGLLHLAVNSFCLLSIVFLHGVSLRRILLSLAVCFTLPVDTIGRLTDMTTPTVGFSGALYFLLGSIAGEVKRKGYYQACICMGLLAGVFNPATNAWIHLYGYLCGLLFAVLTQPYKRR